MNFKDKVVLVTGASSELGRQISIDLADKDAKLALIARNYKALKSTRKLLGKTESIISVCDVANPYDVKKVVDNVLSHFGHVDILINNAGFNILGDFDKLSLNELSQIMNVNYNGAVYFQ